MMRRNSRSPMACNAMGVVCAVRDLTLPFPFAARLVSCCASTDFKLKEETHCGNAKSVSKFAFVFP